MKRIENNKSTIAWLAVLAAFFAAGATHAQTEQTPEIILDEPIEVVQEPEPEEAEEDSDSSEVDFNEENFRRSMELRDRELERSRGLSDSSVSVQPGLQALEGLPEESQKHLRGQLREVIMEQGPWTPADADAVYPYVPSAPAEADGSLKQREETAWGELVAKYHEREAEIHQNSARTAAATGNPTGSQLASPAGAEGMNEKGEPGSDQPGASGETGETEQEADLRAARQAALESMLNSDSGQQAGSEAASAPATATEGVSQNALELLRERQQLPVSAQASSDSTSDAQNQSQQMAQNAQASEQSASADSTAAQQNSDSTVELDLESEGVIAISELEKIDLERTTEDDEP